MAQIWDLWYPGAGAAGLPFARARLDATRVVLVHAAPHMLRVEVRDEAGGPVSRGDDLLATIDRPMARLQLSDGQVTRLDLWPDESDLGRPVILCGGEVGLLRDWWNAPDGSEWRWRLEFSNHR